MRELFQAVYNSRDLAEAHPLRFKNPRKQAILEKCIGPLEGALAVTRLEEVELPYEANLTLPKVESFPGFFDYRASGGTVHWYPNFADPDLFGYWDSDMLAQDELQVLEMPLLASLRERLILEGIPTGTTSYNKSTPWLIEGVQRFVNMNVSGLYGNAFDRAPLEECVAAAQKIDPVECNIYAIAAPACGSGHYDMHQINSILKAAYTAFRGLREETTGECVLHLGYWGCGAFGGNRELMVAAQLCAASMAKVDKVVFHQGGDLDPYLRGFDVFLGMTLQSNLTSAEVVYRLLAEDYHWGESDGN